jgi:hypothetical protein
MKLAGRLVKHPEAYHNFSASCADLFGALGHVWKRSIFAVLKQYYGI